MEKIVKAVALITVLILLGGWKLPIIVKMERLDLPEGCKTVYPTKIRISDVYWLHIKGEKVVKCSLGYEAAKEYIETHNSEFMMRNIQIDPYGGMSDTAIYDSEFDDVFWQQPDRDNYIKIDYFKKISGG